MRKLIYALTILALIIFSGSLAQIGQAQTLSESRVYEGEQHLTPFMVNTTNDTSINSEIAAQPDKVTPNSSAPPLSYISTWNTCGQETSISTLVCENDANALITTNHYPTSSYKVYEVVRIHGYGSTPLARLGGPSGSIVPSSSIVETDYLCGTNYAVCTDGQTVTGFQYWFDITSMRAAGYGTTFYAQSTGTNNPGTTLSATLSIMQ